MNINFWMQDLTSFVQGLLQQMQSRFQAMSEAVIGRIDEMGARIDDLEKSISQLMEQVRQRIRLHGVCSSLRLERDGHRPRDGLASFRTRAKSPARGQLGCWGCSVSQLQAAGRMCLWKCELRCWRGCGRACFLQTRPVALRCSTLPSVQPPVQGCCPF